MVKNNVCNNEGKGNPGGPGPSFNDGRSNQIAGSICNVALISPKARNQSQRNATFHACQLTAKNSTAVVDNFQANSPKWHP